MEKDRGGGSEARGREGRERKKDGSSGKSNGAAATYTDTRCNGVYVLKEMKQGTALANALFLFRGSKEGATLQLSHHS